MITINKYVFLITDGVDLLTVFGWGETMAEARKYLFLNKVWTVVDDSEVIKSFIAEKRQEEMPKELTGWLLRQWNGYNEDLDRMENQLASA